MKGFIWLRMGTNGGLFLNKFINLLGSLKRWEGEGLEFADQLVRKRAPV